MKFVLITLTHSKRFFQFFDLLWSTILKQTSKLIKEDLLKKEKFCSKRLSLFLLFPIQFLLLFSSLQIYKQYQKSHWLISFNFFKFSHSSLIQNTNMMMLGKKRSELNLFGEESFVGHMPISLTSYWISCFWSISLIFFFFWVRFSLFLHQLSNLCFKAFFDY